MDEIGEGEAGDCESPGRISGRVGDGDNTKRKMSKHKTLPLDPVEQLLFEL